jgi:hypothetical protein
MTGIGLGVLSSLIGNLFTVYLFGTTPLGVTLGWIFLMAIFIYMGWKFQLGADAMLLVIGLVGMLSGFFMFEDIVLKSIVGFAFGIILFLGLTRLIRR